MSNETPQDSTPEADLDDVLSQATSLAASLTEEVGDSADPAAVAAPDPINDVKTGTTDTVECELHELERLVASTADEVGADAPASEPGGSSPATESEDEAASSESSAPDAPGCQGSVPDSPTAEAPEQPQPLAVPDFMSEFTEPETPREAVPEVASTETQTAEPAPAADTTATSVGAEPAPAPKPGIVGAPIVQAEDEPSVESMDEPQTQADPQSNTSTTDSPNASAGDAFRAVGRRLEPVGLALCAKGVQLLEAVDRPLGRIGAAPRILLGWLAIATLGTASIVYVISLW